jgi:hypothetical protein
MWKIDPALTRPEHKLHFDWAAEEEWGANVCFLCQNEGCCYSVIVPVNHPDIGKAAGLCFDATQGEIVEK